jgi:hypothetical protein
MGAVVPPSSRQWPPAGGQEIIMDFMGPSLRRGATILCVGALALGMAACGDDSSTDKTGTLVITLSEDVAGDALVDSGTDPDQRYTNTAGNSYSIQIFEYLLTEFSLTSAASGKMAVDLGGAHYRNAFNATTNTLTLEKVPVGSYEQLSFYWGVPDAMNFRDPDGRDGLPGEFEFFGWLDALGGGYHCDRLNGAHYDSQGDEIGALALHMGRLDKGDGELTNCHTQISLGGLDFSITSGQETHLTLSLDVDHITNAPVIDFTVPAGMMGWDMTMPNHMAQAAMRDNMGDVFSVVVEP